MRSRALGLTSGFLCAMVALGADPGERGPHGHDRVHCAGEAEGIAPSLVLVAAVSRDLSHRASRPADRVEAFAWSPNGSSLAYSAAGSARPVEPHRRAPEWHAPQSHLTSRAPVPCPLAWSPDGTSLALPGATGRVFVVRVSDGRVRTVAQLRGLDRDRARVVPRRNEARTARASRPLVGWRSPGARHAWRRPYPNWCRPASRAGLLWSPDGTTLLFVGPGPAVDSLAVGVPGVGAARPRRGLLRSVLARRREDRVRRRARVSHS